MAGFSPAPLPVLSTLFDPIAGFGAGDVAPLPIFGTLFAPHLASTLTAGYGSFTLTGKAAALKGGFKVAAANGSFTLTGEAATLTYNTATGGISNAVPLPSLASLFNLAAGAHVLFASKGSFALTGEPASFVKGYVLTADYGSFTASFPDGICDMQMTASEGAFSLTGEAATLSRVVPGGLVAGTGLFTLTGNPATLVKNAVGANTLIAQGATFTLTGFPVADPVRDFVLVADAGSFALTGVDAKLTGVAWVRIGQTSGTWNNVAQGSTTWTKA